MKFKCKPNGKLMKGAPGNYKCGEKYRIPYRHSRFPFWELLEEKPELAIPDDEDSVYEEEAMFAAKEEPFILPPTDEPLNDVRTKELTESYKRQGMYLLDSEEGVFVDGTTSTENDEVTSSEEDNSDEPKDEEKPHQIREEGIDDRDALKQILDDAGVEYNIRAHTPTLRKMVEELGSKEEP